MTYSLFKPVLITVLLAFVCSQLPQNDGFSKFQQQSCCPAGYNSAAGIYCVKCNAPKHWDPVNQRCVTCEPGHAWDNVTHECSCCNLPRVVIGNDCSCPPPKT